MQLFRIKRPVGIALIGCVMAFHLMAYANAQVPPNDSTKQLSDTLKSVIIEKTNGDRMTGLFAGADENAVRIKIAETVLNIPLAKCRQSVSSKT